MEQDKFCKSCPEKNTCQQVYENLGKSGGKSVTKKVLTAFLLPIAVFIGGLAVFDKLLAGSVEKQQVRSALALLFSLLLTFALIFVLRLFSDRKNRK
ncbi:MAG: hypothetical protein PHF37_10995 [Phycisphaerae bacterium]|nr:hypothetical protein [Phycisphaerae bacterium]